MPQLIPPLSHFLHCVKFCDSRLVLNSTQSCYRYNGLFFHVSLIAWLVFKKPTVA